MSNGKITVVGAGVVGLSCALYLQRAGRAVTVIDRLGPGEACSFGNCGGIAVTEFMPLSQPGHLAKVPGWLLDPLGPLAVRWPYLPRLAPWLLRFLMAGTKKRVAEVVAAAAPLSHSTWDDLLPLLRSAGVEDMVAPDECLTLYGSEAEYRADRDKWAFCEIHGFPHETLPGEELRQLEPDLAPDFARGVINKGWRHVHDPFRLVQAFAEDFARQGGVLKRAEVRGIEAAEGGVRALHLADGTRQPVESLVIAGGAWSHRLARQIGDRVPLEADRGYHTTIADPGVSPRRQIVHPAQGLAITPLEMGLRIGGSVELGGLDAPPNYARARAQVERARRIYPGLKKTEGSRWMGPRPSLPDSLPVISRATRAPNAYYAFGHGHLGLTWAATTGRLIAELVTGREPGIDLAPYRVDRF